MLADTGHAPYIVYVYFDLIIVNLLWLRLK